MNTNINDCDFNNDYFHFTNKQNRKNIENKGLVKSAGIASELVNDFENISVAKGGKGIMEIINSFLYKAEMRRKMEHDNLEK